MREENGLVVYEVSEFIQYLNDTLISIVDPRRIAIEGEVSSFGVSQGKLVTFSLKDQGGLINCFLVFHQLKVPLEDGMKIRVYGYPKVYAKLGKLSITVQRIELVGEGALRRAYELLKKKLAEEGLFAPERKRRLPRFPERIGLITSRESAACGDFLRIINNRWPGLEILLAHVQVQGEPAPMQIASAFRAMNALATPPEVIVLARGGGSLEELSAFNDERVARAIFSSKIPVIVGVGHERDESIADYVADRRASTPSNAAEILVPDKREITFALRSMSGAIERAFAETLLINKNALMRTASRLEAEIQKIVRGVEIVFSKLQGSFREFVARLATRSSEISRREFLFESRARTRLAELTGKLTVMERLILSLDPKAVLRRGYAIVSRVGGGIIRNAEAVDAGERLNVQLHRGALAVEVLGDEKSQGRLSI